MKRLLISTATEPTIKIKHKERLVPLYRSKTQDNQYDNKNNSPITQFVCNLLGIYEKRQILHSCIINIYQCL